MDTNNNPIGVQMNGAIDHEKYVSGHEVSVSFERFPASTDEFVAVRNIIGTEPQGAVVLQLMAMEMYRRNRTMGEECLKLCNTTLNVSAMRSRLSEIYSSDPNYGRPYQVAAFLEGASPQNSYTTTEPYTVRIVVNPVRGYLEFNTYKTHLISLGVYSRGYNVAKYQIVGVMKTKKAGEPSENKFFIVSESPGLTVQPNDPDDEFAPLK